jgi:hypothetical protein
MLHPRPKQFKFFMMVSLILILPLSSVLPIAASDTGEVELKAFYPPKLTPVQVTSQSYIELKEALIFPVQGGKTVTYQLTFVNNENFEIAFIDYWARLESKTGIRYTLNLLDDGKDSNMKIPPKSTMDFSFSANVGSTTQITDLVLKIVRFDFSYPDYQRTLGTIQLPKNYSTIVPVDRLKPIKVSNSIVNTKVMEYSSYSTGDYDSNTIELDMENVGNRMVTLPEYNYYIQTPTGIMYQLERNDTELKTIQARDRKTINLTVETPKAVDMAQSDLIIIQTQNEREIPVAQFELPQASTEQPKDPGTTLGQEFEFKNSSGGYGMILNSVQRLPWEDEDIIAADVTLINRDTKSVPIPNFQGLFELDGVELNDMDLKFVSLDSIYGLKQNARTNILMYIKVPYTFEYEHLKIVLQEQDSKSSAIRDLIEFEYEGKDLTLTQIKENKKYTLDDIGRRAEIGIRTVHTYEGESSDVFYVELEMENIEKRQTLMTRLKGYFKTNDDIFFPAEVAVVKDKMMPKDKALLSFSSELPKGYTMDDLQIVIGQGLNDKTLAVGEEEMEAFMKAVSMKLPAEEVTVSKELRDLEFMPYKLNIRNIRTTLKTIEGDSKGVISFRYDLTDESPYFVNPEGHSILVEFEVEDIFYSKELKFGTDLVEGTNDSEVVVDIHSILTKIVGLNQYKLNIYDIYDGHKKLIATKTMNWYVTYD